MPKRFLFSLLVILLLLPWPAPAFAQSDLLLPADLFVLIDAGQVLRIEATGGFASLVTPPDQVVADFGVAPDGRWLAYRTTPAGEGGMSFLAITTIDGVQGQVIEFDTAGLPPVTGRGQTMAWSPDAAAIAYTTAAGLRLYFPGMGEGGGPRFQDIGGGPFFNLAWSPGGGYLAAEAENNDWTIYRRELGALAELGRLSAPVTWLREGALAVTPPAGGVVALNLADNSQTTLAGAEVIASHPALISGGRVIFLIHEESQQFAARRFGTVTLAGGDYQEVEAAAELTQAMDWLPDGTAMIANEDGVLSILEPRTASRRELIENVKSFGWGPISPQEVTDVPLPAELYFISRDGEAVPQVWRIPAGGGAAQQITSEPESVIDFAVSPDGGRLAFTSAGALYVMGMDGANRLELSATTDRPGEGSQPAWRPDGGALAFVRDGIWTVASEGGLRQELATDVLSADTPPEQVRVYGAPRWSPDGALLLVGVSFFEGGALGVLPAAGGEVTLLPVPTSDGAWLPNGQIATWAASSAYTTPGLYLVNPADLGAFVPVLDETWPVADAVVLANEAAAIVRSASGGDSTGPSSVQPFLIPLLPDALAIPNGQGGLVESPVLAPDGNFAAGLRDPRPSDYGQAGQLVVINLATGERFAVRTPGEIWSLQWGPRV